MGSFRQSYFGPYVRIWMPERIATISSQTCTNEECEKYGEHIRHKFCGHCGAPVERINISKPSHLTLNDFLLEEFNDEDMFTAVYPDKVDYIIAVPNRPGEKQGGTFFTNSPLTEVLSFTGDGIDSINHYMNDFDKEDWTRLSMALLKRDIKYEQRTGILQWFC